jgi:hypothetical protein
MVKKFHDLVLWISRVEINTKNLTVDKIFEILIF